MGGEGSIIRSPGPSSESKPDLADRHPAAALHAARRPVASGNRGRRTARLAALAHVHALLVGRRHPVLSSLVAGQREAAELDHVLLRLGGAGRRVDRRCSDPLGPPPSDHPAAAGRRSRHRPSARPLSPLRVLDGARHQHLRLRARGAAGGPLRRAPHLGSHQDHDPGPRPRRALRRGRISHGGARDPGPRGTAPAASGGRGRPGGGITVREGVLDRGRADGGRRGADRAPRAQPDSASSGGSPGARVDGGGAGGLERRRAPGRARAAGTEHLRVHRPALEQLHHRGARRGHGPVRAGAGRLRGDPAGRAGLVREPRRGAQGGRLPPPSGCAGRGRRGLRGGFAALGLRDRVGRGGTHLRLGRPGGPGDRAGAGRGIGAEHRASHRPAARRGGPDGPGRGRRRAGRLLPGRRGGGAGARLRPHGGPGPQRRGRPPQRVRAAAARPAPSAKRSSTSGSRRSAGSPRASPTSSTIPFRPSCTWPKT